MKYQRFFESDFILHWSSERPVPRVIIDYGDGRKLERTLTGNSAHYVLDSNGIVLDVLPGLYAPRTFLRSLERIEQLAQRNAKAASVAERRNIVAQYHRTRLRELDRDWMSDLIKAGIQNPPDRALPSSGSGTPDAEAASLRVITKSGIERPMLRGLALLSGPADAELANRGWPAIAALYANDSELDDQTKALIRIKNPRMGGAGDTVFQTAVAGLERAIAEDTARNKYVLETKIHVWLSRPAPIDFETLNKRIYSELFLTPASDPWLGLLPPELYSGIERDGIVE